MKLPILKSFLTLLLIVLTNYRASSAEFLVRDEICSIDADIDPWEGARKWYFDGVGPANWLSPDNYYNGTFHFRYEIISQPTDRGCGAQFVIWQDWNYPEWLEQASSHVLLNGEGDIAFGSGSPASWWMHDGTPLDFSRPDDFYKFGIMVWSMDPFGQIAYYRAEQPGEDIYDEIWNDRHDWFPMTLRFTIVAVSAGSTFSGDWDSYMGIEPGIQPAYTVNFPDESTNEVVLEQHQYSYDNATWNEGTGTQLSLTPSSAVYFRDKNDNSLTQTLVVPPRPSIPSFTIDYANERTTTVVSSAFEYSQYSDISQPQFGTGNYLSITPGVTMYFRQLATSLTFRSLIQSLPVPVRPEAPFFSVDFINERTVESVGTDMEYSSDELMVGSQTGTANFLALIPGEDVFIRKKAKASAFASFIYKIEVPERPAPIEYTIDFENESTTESVAENTLYAEGPDFNSYQPGINQPADLTPGKDMYFKQQADAGHFESSVFMLSVPERPLFSSNSSSPTQDNPIVVDLSFAYPVTLLDTEKLIPGNATIGSISGEYAIELIPQSEGMVYIRLEADAVPEGNFASVTLSIEYDPDNQTMTQVKFGDKDILYPNPAQGAVYLISGLMMDIKRVTVCEASGRIVLNREYSGDFLWLNTDCLKPGVYQVVFFMSDETSIARQLVITE